MNEAEKIRHLEDRVRDIEETLDRICSHEGTCNFAEENKPGKEEKHKSAWQKLREEI